MINIFKKGKEQINVDKFEEILNNFSKIKIGECSSTYEKINDNEWINEKTKICYSNHVMNLFLKDSIVKYNYGFTILK